jgi:tetratricopeptide (TPR) repeat protein
MNQNDADSSPLKLYQRAYELHYKERKISDACSIYEQLIKRFPDSDVSGYASIQLHKIHANEITRKMARQLVPPFPVLLLLIVSVLLLAAAALMFGIHVRRLNDQHMKHSSVSRALAKMSADKDDEALDVLREVKISFRKDITPFALSAEIYRKNHDYLRARKEYETYRRLYPKDPLPEAEIEEINKEEDAHIKRLMEEKKKTKALPEEVVKAQAKKRATRAVKRRRRRVVAPVKPKPKMLVPADSISYF